jgi:hypothetical protein
MLHLASLTSEILAREENKEESKLKYLLPHPGIPLKSMSAKPARLGKQHAMDYDSEGGSPRGTPPALLLTTIAARTLLTSKLELYVASKCGFTLKLSCNT